MGKSYVEPHPNCNAIDCFNCCSMHVRKIRFPSLITITNAIFGFGIRRSNKMQSVSNVHSPSSLSLYRSRLAASIVSPLSFSIHLLCAAYRKIHWFCYSKWLSFVQNALLTLPEPVSDFDVWITYWKNVCTIIANGKSAIDDDNKSIWWCDHICDRDECDLLECQSSDCVSSVIRAVGCVCVCVNWYVEAPVDLQAKKQKYNYSIFLFFVTVHAITSIWIDAPKSKIKSYMEIGCGECVCVSAARRRMAALEQKLHSFSFVVIENATALKWSRVTNKWTKNGKRHERKCTKVQQHSAIRVFVYKQALCSVHRARKANGCTRTITHKSIINISERIVLCGRCHCHSFTGNLTCGFCLRGFSFAFLHLFVERPIYRLPVKIFTWIGTAGAWGLAHAVHAVPFSVHMPASVVLSIC